jgi:hypothetical protein
MRHEQRQDLYPRCHCSIAECHETTRGSGTGTAASRGSRIAAARVGCQGGQILQAPLAGSHCRRFFQFAALRQIRWRQEFGKACGRCRFEGHTRCRRTDTRRTHDDGSTLRRRERRVENSSVFNEVSAFVAFAASRRSPPGQLAVTAMHLFAARAPNLANFPVVRIPCAA